MVIDGGGKVSNLQQSALIIGRNHTFFVLSSFSRRGVPYSDAGSLDDLLPDRRHSGSGCRLHRVPEEDAAEGGYIMGREREN